LSCNVFLSVHQNQENHKHSSINQEDPAINQENLHGFNDMPLALVLISSTRAWRTGLGSEHQVGRNEWKGRMPISMCG
jgi:hypothetical protein